MSQRAASLSLHHGGQELDANRTSRIAVLPPETANQWTHGLGLVLSLAASGVMLATLARHGDALRTLGCAVYLGTLVALYAASTLSHSFDDPVRRSFFRMLDQVCIFLLIAGTYTPFGLMHVREGWWNFILISMWALAGLGVVLRLLRGEGGVPFLFYALIGWIPVLTLGRIFEVGGLSGLLLVMGGGAAYTGGLWLLVNDDRRPYLHAAWHLSTIVGSVCHFLFLEWYVAAWPGA